MEIQLGVKIPWDMRVNACIVWVTPLLLINTVTLKIIEANKGEIHIMYVTASSLCQVALSGLSFSTSSIS